MKDEEKIKAAATEMYEVAKRHGLNLGEYKAALHELTWKEYESTKEYYKNLQALPLK